MSLFSHLRVAVVLAHLHVELAERAAGPRGGGPEKSGITCIILTLALGVLDEGGVFIYDDGNLNR